jgi:dTDP-4-amino-4,6-dideoxygalactose transaminase
MLAAVVDRVPFNLPRVVGSELDYIGKAIDGGHTSSGGPFTRAVCDLLREWHGSADVLLTTSCTDALEMAAMLLDIQPGDVVVVPSFTFTSTALAFARAGATLRFADIEPRTLGLDPLSVAPLMGPEVRAVVTVNYAGVACDLDGLDAVIGGGAELIEDNAHGLFGRHRGQPLGTFGRFSTLSFHETKNFFCGEGGALVVRDQADVERAHVLLDKGTNRREFLLGQTDKYSWRDLGSSFGLSDLLAAFLLAQLEQADHVLATRAAIARRYRERLEPYATRLGLQLPFVPESATSAHHMFYVLLPTGTVRDKVLAALGEVGIHATFHYVPLHSSDAGRRFGDTYRDLPVTDDVSRRLLRLPFFNELAASDIDRVATELVKAVERAA